jgi:uncharacterized protein YozE (UPF0346 family)
MAFSAAGRLSTSRDRAKGRRYLGELARDVAGDHAFPKKSGDCKASRNSFVGLAL